MKDENDQVKVFKFVDNGSSIQIVDNVLKEKEQTSLDQHLFCIGSEVGAYLGYFRGDLFKKFPLIWRRYVTSEERKLLIQTNIIESFAPPSLTLVKYEDFVNLKDDKGYLYKTSSQSSEQKRFKQPPLIPLTPVKKIKESIPIQPTMITPITPLKVAKEINEVRIRTEDLLNHDDLSRLANYKELKSNLAPIRLDIDANSKRLRDIFIWDKNDNSITPEMFALIECQDFNLEPKQFSTAIADSIKSQLEAHINPKSLRLPVTKQDIITIKYEIPIGHTCLTDCLEWDANNSDETAPENFAQKTCSELGLGGEFACLIAYSIKTQVLQHLKLKSMEKMRTANEAIKSIYRSEMESEIFCPKIEILSEEDLQKKLSNSERTNRRTRRSSLLNFI